MQNYNKLLLPLFTLLLMATGAKRAAAQTTVLTEDFSGSTNIFGVTTTQGAAGTPFLFDSGLNGFGTVLAVCKSTAEGAITRFGQPVVAGEDHIVTVEYDAFHGYFGNSRSSSVSLLNSDGQSIVSYDYSSQSCQVTAVRIGGQAVAGFQAFALQGANGFSGNGKPYSANNNPHITISLSPEGVVTAIFAKGGSTVKKVNGSVNGLKKDIAKMTISSTVENTDRCYAVDNIKVTTERTVIDPNYIEPIASAVIKGPERMTFGPDTDTPYANEFTVSLIGEEGTTITEQNLDPKVQDFQVTWDIEGFRTVNDTEGQYCDSYGSFSANGEASVRTSFLLRDVPMNFYGRLTATIRYNGTTTRAEKYVVALGDLSHPSTQVLPLAGYPVNFSTYPDALKGYVVTKDTYGTQSDPILGGWCVAGSDNHNATLMTDADGKKFVRLTSLTQKKSHVITHALDTPSSQLIFSTMLRFNNAGATLTFTGGNPFWTSTNYSCPVMLSFSGNALALNGTALTTPEGSVASFTTGKWYRVVLSADKSSECCYARVYNQQGELLGQTSVIAWAESCNPKFFSLGMDNSNTGSVDMSACEAYKPTIAADSYTLTADKTTLSIPQDETARLTATLTDVDGLPVTQQAIWSVLEPDMQQSVIITPDAADSHVATVSLSPTAQAGTATVQVSIGGSTKSVQLTLTADGEGIRFTQSTTSINIPLDEGQTVSATYAAIVINGEGRTVDTPVTLAAYDRNGKLPYTFGTGVSFDAATGVLTVSNNATPARFTIRATARSSQGEELSRSVSVSLNGLRFDFGFTNDDGVADGFTAVGPTTAYSDAAGFGIVSGSVTVGGIASATNADSDYLQGAMQFDFKAEKGAFYTVEVTFQGVLTTAHINADLAGYELATHNSLATKTFTLPATRGAIDLHLADANGTAARLAKIIISKNAPRKARSKRVVHHIGDSTSANNGSWAYRLKNIISSTYAELAALCQFHNDGAGGRNLSTYYTQGKLANVLADIYPGDILMLGNMGTNGMGKSFEADVNYYLDAAEALGAKVILNSYTPHGAVSNYSSGYNSSTHTFNSYRKDSYETVIRRVAEQRAKNDPNYIGFVEIGKNADAIFNLYVSDYAANGYASPDAAAQAIIKCFTDHNHYSNGTLACDLMLGGYGNLQNKGIVAQLVSLLSSESAAINPLPAQTATDQSLFTLSGQPVADATRPGLYITQGRVVVKRR